MVDSDYRFPFLSARVVGSRHDFSAHSVSGLGTLTRERKLPYPFWIAGDQAYICAMSLIFPYPISECGPVKSEFKLCLSSYREHIEQAFGQLVARWSCLKKVLLFDLRKTVRIITVCMKLHNICLDTNDLDFTSHKLPQDKHEIQEEAIDWVSAFRRTDNTTTGTVCQCNSNNFTSMRG